MDVICTWPLKQTGGGELSLSKLEGRRHHRLPLPQDGRQRSRRRRHRDPGHSATAGTLFSALVGFTAVKIL